MSLTGTTATFIPYTLDGLQELTVDTSSVNTIQVNSLTPNRVVVADGSNYLVSAGASTTEVDYLIGTTSSVQTQLNSKVSQTYVDTNFLNKTTTSAQTVEAATTFNRSLTGNSGFYTDVSGYYFGRPNVNYNSWSIKRVANGTQIRDLLFKDDTAAQETLKLSTDGQTVYTGLICDYATASKIPIFDANKNLVSSGVDASKIDYLDNVSSDIQTQLNTLSTNKADITYVDTQDALRVPYTGATQGLDMGSHRIQTTFSPALGSDVINKTYGDATYATSASLGNYLPLTGGSLTGSLSISSTNTTLTCNISGTNAQLRDAIRITTTKNHYDGTNPATTYLFSGPTGYLMIGEDTERDDTTANLMIGAPSGSAGISEVLSVKSDGSGFLPLNFGGSSYRFTAGDVLSDENIQITGAKVVEFGYGVSGKEANAGKIGYQTFTSGCLDIVGAGGDTRRVRIWDRLGIGASPDYPLDINGEGRVRNSFYVGTEGNASSQIFFGGPSGDTAYDHCVIECRSLGSGEKSELLLFKGNDHSNGAGPDRVRLRGAEIAFDTYSSATTNRVAENIRMIVKEDGKVGIGKTDPGQTLDVNGFIRAYGNSSGGPSGVYTENASSGDAYAVMFLRNNNAGTGCYWFMNSTTRSGDGGANTATLRNDAGVLRLQSSGGFGIFIKDSTGAVNVAGDTTYAVPNNYMGRGSLTIGSTTANYGGGWGWNSNTAGLMMECSDTTEIAIHDSGTRVASFMYYYGPSNYLYMGRDVGWGTTTIYVLGAFRANSSVYAGSSTTVGGGCGDFSQNWDRMLLYANGYNTSGGYFYYNQGNSYGTISDRRIKQDFQPVPEEQSVAFIKALEPTSFCLKEQTTKHTVKRVGKDGKTIEEEACYTVCSCRQDGWVAQNVLEACVKSGVSKSVVNHWADYEKEQELPEEERKTLIGVSDRPILSHTVNVVKVLLNRIEVLEARNGDLESRLARLEKILEVNGLI